MMTAAQAAALQAIDTRLEAMRVGRVESVVAMSDGAAVGPLVSTYFGDGVNILVAVDSAGLIVSIERGWPTPGSNGGRASLWDEPIGREIRLAASQLDSPLIPRKDLP